MNEHVHTLEDGIGRRRVTLNGHEVKAVYADTRKGKVVYIPQPPKVDKWKKRVITRTAHGLVEVTPL